MQFINDYSAYLKYLYENCHCINAGQSQEERRLKYAIARYLGKNPSWAGRLRDFRPSIFARFFGYSSWKNLMEVIGGDLLEK